LWRCLHNIIAIEKFFNRTLDNVLVLH